MVRCLIAIIFRKQKSELLQFSFQQDWITIPEHRKLLNSIYISRIDPVFGEFLNVFPKEEIGILVFVNGEEPGNGKVGLQEFYPSIGDKIEIVYIAFDRGGIKAGDLLKSDKQLDLFSISLFETKG